MKKEKNLSSPTCTKKIEFVFKNPQGKFQACVASELSYTQHLWKK